MVVNYTVKLTIILTNETFLDTAVLLQILRRLTRRCHFADYF